jgi:hypothetical protein
MKRHIHRVTSTFSSLHEHLVAFVIAIFVIWGVWVVFLYRDSLFADITAAQSTTVTQQYEAPLVYSVQDGKLTVSATKQFTAATSLSFILFFDPKTVLFALEKAKSPYEFTYAPAGDNMVQVTVLTKWTVDQDTVLYEVPVNGSVEDVTVTNAGIMRDDVFETIAIQKK